MHPSRYRMKALDVPYRRPGGKAVKETGQRQRSAIRRRGTAVSLTRRVSVQAAIETSFDIIMYNRLQRVQVHTGCMWGRYVSKNKTFYKYLTTAQI